MRTVDYWNEERHWKRSLNQREHHKEGSLEQMLDEYDKTQKIKQAMYLDAVANQEAGGSDAESSLGSHVNKLLLEQKGEKSTLRKWIEKFITEF